MSKRIRGNIMLLIAALLWGTTFVAQSEGMRYVEPFTYNAVRTLIGGIVLIPVIAAFNVFSRKTNPPESKTSKKATIIGGMACGVVLFAASSLQQCGMTMTTAGKAGFITALYIVIVPLIELVIYRRSNVFVWICVVVASAGFYLLCIKEGFKIGRGDWFVLCCTVFFALHIMVIDYFNSRNADGIVLACIQFFTAGTLMAIAMLLFESPKLNAVLNARYTILYAGIMSSGIAYTLQILGQRYTAPAAATLIMSLESVFAALSGWLILHEVLSLKETAGCVLVFIAVILAQLKLPDKSAEKIISGRRRKNEKISQ
ncbi:MAG: DMT family transporter [Ruminococcus sp.]|nr:DMT family transporter [Ruminococcus sp.]